MLKIMRVGIGGFFSSFGYETLSIANQARGCAALANIAGQILFGLSAVWFGHWLATSLRSVS